MIQSGNITLASMIWAEHLGDWTQAKLVPELANTHNSISPDPKQPPQPFS